MKTHAGSRFAQKHNVPGVRVAVNLYLKKRKNVKNEKTKKTTYHAALDTSGNTAEWAVALPNAEDNCVIRASFAAVRRESAALPLLLQRALAAADLELDQIRQWTVGMGPGSFTGIRTGAALVAGICQGTGASCRGIPGSLAMVRELDSATGIRLAGVLHDGRHGEVLLSSYQRVNGGIWQEKEAPCSRSLDEAEEWASAFDRFVMLEQDRSRSELPEIIRYRTRFIPAVNAARLLEIPGHPWRTEICYGLEPVYVRPAVFIDPTPPSHPIFTQEDLSPTYPKEKNHETS